MQKKSIDTFSRKLGEKVLIFLNPRRWPYFFVDKKGTQYFAGNAHRQKEYIASAKKGTLDSQLSASDQRKHALAYMEKLMELPLHRFLSSILAHEYEHSKDEDKKHAIFASLVLAPIIPEVGLLISVLNEAQSHTVPGENIKVAVGATVFSMLGKMVMGIIAGNVHNEQKSYDAEKTNFRAFTSCISINSEVFKREVLGQRTQQNIVNGE